MNGLGKKLFPHAAFPVYQDVIGTDGKGHGQLLGFYHGLAVADNIAEGVVGYQPQSLTQLFQLL